MSPPHTGDSKTRGLNMENTRLTQPTKLSTLLVIIILAWADACATAIKGPEAIKSQGSWLPHQIMVPSRFGSAQKVDPA